VREKSSVGVDLMSTKPKVLLVGTIDVDARLELMRFLRDDFDISALGSSESLHEKFQAEGFEYTYYPLNRKANPISDVIALIRLFFIFRRLKPDLVHAFDTKPCVWARIAARLAGVPVVIGTLPGLGSLYVNESFINRLIRSVYQVLQKIACGISNLTIFQNKDDAAQFIKDKIVSPQKVMVIPGSGVSTDQFAQTQVSESAKAALKNELQIQPGKIVISMVSRIIKTKGVFEFLESAREINGCYSNVYFLLVGPVDNESLDRLSDSELEQLKQVTNWIGPRRDIATILAVSDIFVLPSAYREGIPRVLLEAASMGLPIITTDSPGCREVADNDVNGFLVPLYDAAALSKAMARLVEDPELRQRFGQISRQRAVEEFDSVKIANRTRAKYQQLLAQSVPSRKE
jgi:glycosyltransferase involved in cell wall biosynthesis